MRGVLSDCQKANAKLALLPMRWIFRFLFIFLVAVCLAGGVLLAWFSSWRVDKLASLAEGSEVVETAAGQVEVAHRGDGATILSIHAAPGGYDQALLFGADLADHGFHIVAPSRPGYLRTPLTSGLTPEDQADALAAALDSLQIEGVGLLAASCGTPTALAFASRYPNRVWAMVLISSLVSRQSILPQKLALPVEFHRAVTGDIGSWWLLQMAERDPARALAETFRMTSSGDETARAVSTKAVLKSPSQLAWFRAFLGTTAPINPRESGFRNDLLQIRALPEFPLATMQVPTLFIHGTDDPFASLEEVKKAVALMPRASLLPIEHAGHLVELGPNADTLSPRILEFFQQHSGSQSPP